MRTIINTITILMFLMLSNRLEAQNEIYFKYNSNDQELTIWSGDSNGKNGVTFGFYDSISPEYSYVKQLFRRCGFSKEITKEDSSKLFITSKDSIVLQCTDFDTNKFNKITFYKESTNDLIKEMPLKKHFIFDTVPSNSQTTDGSTIENGDRTTLTIILVVVVAILFAGGAFFILPRRKKKDGNNTLPAPEGGKPIPGMKIVRSQTQNRTVGLEHVREHNEEYFLLDMQNQFDDTAIHRIFLHHTVIKKTYDFFKTFLESANRTPETGCFFIGCWEYADESHMTYNISVEDIVEPGDDIEPDEYSFNFGYKIGGYLDMKIRNMREKTGRDYVHTVWMHSHPGLGLFLSSQDLVVQDLLKNKKEPGRLIAFVIDTNSANWELAVFTSKTNGEMNNKSDMKHTYSLDELYEWSRKAKKQFSNEERDWDNYLKIELNGKGGNGFSALYMSGKAINQMEEATYVTSNANNVKFLSGNADTPGNWCCIEECNQKNDSIIGILIIDSESSYETIFTKYEDSIRDSLIIMVYRSDEEIWISSRKDLNEQYNGSEKMTQYTMGQMREWIRRKRIP